MKTYNVAIVGATGVVGREILETLEQRQFPVESLKLLASKRSAGESISFQGHAIRVRELNESSFEGVDIALFSAGSSISEKYAPIAAKAGALAIDNTSFFRMDPSIPLIVPEVNGHAIKNNKGIIANPNCSTAQLVMALKPIHDEATIERLVISTYQSVSGAGKDAIQELEVHTKCTLQGQNPDPENFTAPISFNAIPHIDVFQDNGYTKEEMKMIQETNKILESDIHITATAVRIPVFISHSESVNIQTKKPLSVEKAKELLNNMPGVTVMDDIKNNVYPTARNCAGKDDVYVGRIRKDISTENGIDCWIVADNLRKGAALNAVQIAEYYIQTQTKVVS